MDIIILMKKDDPIARLDFDGKILKRFELYNKEQLPIGFINPAFPLEAGFRNIITNLDNWIKTRQIPNTREGYEEIKLKLNLKDMTNIIMNNYGLSLNDSYWFKKYGDNVTWSEINFFNNNYSKEFGDFLLNPKFNLDNVNLISPDLTTNGDDIKRWVQKDNVSYLIKTNYKNSQVACNEVFASNLCYLLNIPHIEYKLIRQNINVYAGTQDGFKQKIDIYNDTNCLFSICKNYCTENLSYISAQTYLHSIKPATITNLYKEMTKDPKFKEKIDQIIILDYLINNTDRHLNNFGFLVNNKNEIIDVFPVFDCGNSMNYMNRFNKDKHDYSKMFNKTFGQLLATVSDFSKYNLNIILNIDDMFYKIYEKSDLSEEEKDSILHLFKERVKYLQQYIFQKK